jgi:hypothetical protein
MYNKSGNRNAEPVMLRTCRQNQGLLLSAAVLFILPTFVMFMARATRIQPGHVGVKIYLAGDQRGGSETRITVWVAPSLVRVGPTDAPGKAPSINLSGARGETVDSQVVVRAQVDSSLTHPTSHCFGSIFSPLMAPTAPEAPIRLPVQGRMRSL